VVQPECVPTIYPLNNIHNRRDCPEQDEFNRQDAKFAKQMMSVGFDLAFFASWRLAFATL